ncbi:hypothetical protein SprV_0200817600 [Sparganum proliferum]
MSHPTSIPASYSVFFPHPPDDAPSMPAFHQPPTPPSPAAAFYNCLIPPDVPGIEAERFTTLRQTPRQSVDDFVTELTRLASAAFPNLPTPDHDDFILYRFISGLLDHTITDSYLLHPPLLFAWCTDTIGRTQLIQHTIDTVDAKPVWQLPRRTPVRYRQEVNKLLDELLQAKIIQPSSSTWASPITLVPKKDGSVRLCIYYCRLNAVTVRDSFPLPRLDDTLDALGNAAWYSTLDLKYGYWQVEIHPDDRHKTAFTVPQGLYEFQTLPLGLYNAAATFQRLMYRVLQPLIPDKCLVYLDDIIVFGRSIDEHNHNLRAVLEALRAHLNLPDRIKCIRTWPASSNQTELRSFLGAPLQPMTTGFPGERVGLNILGPLPISVRGFEYVLVMVDYFTKWVEAVPLLRQDAASDANAISRTWISRWGAPLSFRSDCDANFQSQLLEEVCEFLEIRKTRTTSYHSEGNGLVERTN